jgi:hypothetical protein
MGNVVQDTGSYATVPGGADNVATGPFSLAAGVQARADNMGSFVWSDAQGSEFMSEADNEFAVRAEGGLRLHSARGVRLEASDSPLITRGLDPFLSGPKAGLGRWGLFMEQNHLVAGIPDVAGRFSKWRGMARAARGCRCYGWTRGERGDYGGVDAGQ